MSAASPLYDLCALDDIRVPGSRGFELDGGGAEAVKLFVVRKEDVLAAYRNRCTHTGAPLEWLPDQFLDMDDGFIQCAIHGASTEGATLYCTLQPCILCTKIMLNAGIRRVVFSQGYPDEESISYLKEGGVEIVRLQYPKAPSSDQ